MEQGNFYKSEVFEVTLSIKPNYPDHLLVFFSPLIAPSFMTCL